MDDNLDGLAMLSGMGSNSFKRNLAQSLEYYLSGPILSPDNYVEWFNEIRHAGPDDSVKIHLNTGGGDVDTALQFTRVLGETQAHVTCSVEGSCMSAGTMIFLCADSWEITPHSLWMFHNYSGGIVGKGGEQYDQAVFEREWSTKFLGDIYKHFLTPEEIQSLLDNKDIWMHSDEVELRLHLRAEALEKEYAKQQTE